MSLPYAAVAMKQPPPPLGGGLWGFGGGALAVNVAVQVVSALRVTLPPVQPTPDQPEKR